MKVKELEEIVHTEKISKHKGIFTFRKGFFYTMGGSSTKFREKIEKTLIENDIRFETIEDGEHWAAFNGGASIEKSSHWYVRIRIY